jgi:hypothetical protein
MDLEQLLDAVDHLSPEEREKLKAHLVGRAKPRTVEEWMAEFADIAAEFRGDSTDEEMREIFEAMNMKSKPSKKAGLPPGMPREVLLECARNLNADPVALDSMQKAIDEAFSQADLT